MFLCNATHKDRLLRLLAAEPVANLFLIADINEYGFSQPFQTVWTDGEADAAVYLLYYDNLSVYAARPQAVSPAFLQSICNTHPVGCIMGKRELLDPVLPKVSGYEVKRKVMCALLHPEKLLKGTAVEVAVLSDANEVYDFVNSAEELKNMYASKEMLLDRIRKKPGSHVFLREEGAITAHGNTAAATATHTMIGGIAAASGKGRDERYRHIVAALCHRVMAAGKTPCALAHADWDLNLLMQMGFVPVCEWSVATTTT